MNHGMKHRVLIREITNKLLIDYYHNRKYNLVSLTAIKKVINDVISLENKKYNGWGSYRGYYTFTHHDLMKEVNKKLQLIIRKILARNKINQIYNEQSSGFRIYYTDLQQTQNLQGRMYNVVETHFNQMASISENTPKQSLTEF